MFIWSSEPEVDLGDDAVICEDDSVTFSASGDYDFLWSTGSTDTIISVNQEGEYWLQVSNVCGDTIDTVAITGVYTYPDPDLGDDQQICEGGMITLQIVEDYTAYNWSTGATDQSIGVGSSGTYSVTVSNNGCEGSDSVDIVVKPYPEVEIGENTLLCDGNITYTVGEENALYNILWNDGSTGTDYTVSAPGIYSVVVSNSCGEDGDTVVVGECPSCIAALPTAFSPNGDGHNDVLQVIGNEIDEVKVLIYNRYGELVFVIESLEDAWDGTFRGKMQTSEVFVYYMTAKCLDGEEIERKGTITIVN
ncbi:MAG: hypothetical protein C0594_03955 [Marinilabiliales bacterium]|nr:MAG: hypothetical protein C0594_03955 [Marinilabiliales bacterium]